jgi:hypothetical protein
MFHSQEPPRKAEHLRFTKLRLEPKQKVYGWKSGPHVGLSTHFLGSTKPCIKLITEGKLKCQCELLELRTQWALWMPFIDRTGQKMVAMSGEGAKEAVSRIPFGAPICVSKGKHSKTPYLIYEEAWTQVPCPYLRSLHFQHDIKPWLLQMWQLPELISHFGMYPERIPITASESDVLERIDEDKAEALQLLKRFTDELKGKQSDTQPSPISNGKHKKTKPLTGD